MKVYDNATSLSPARLALGAAGIAGGLWMVLAPFALNYGGTTVLNATTKKMVPVDLSAVTTSDIICGVLLLALTGFCLLTATSATMAKVRYYANIAVIVTGVYLLAAPYLFDLLKVASYLGLDKPNTSNQLVGLLTIILAGFAFQHEFITPAAVDTTGPARTIQDRAAAV